MVNNNNGKYNLCYYMLSYYYLYGLYIHITKYILMYKNDFLVTNIVGAYSNVI